MILAGLLSMVWSLLGQDPPKAASLSVPAPKYWLQGPLTVAVAARRQDTTITSEPRHTMTSVNLGMVAVVAGKSWLYGMGPARIPVFLIPETWY